MMEKLRMSLCIDFVRFFPEPSLSNQFSCTHFATCSGIYLSRRSAHSRQKTPVPEFGSIFHSRSRRGGDNTLPKRARSPGSCTAHTPLLRCAALDGRAGSGPASSENSQSFAHRRSRADKPSPLVHTRADDGRRPVETLWEVIGALGPNDAS